MKKTSNTTPTSGTNVKGLSSHTRTKVRVVFFGNERIATGVQTDCQTLKKLIESGYDIAAVVISHEVRASRSTRPLEIAELATHYGIPLLAPQKPIDILEQLTAYEAAVGVLVAYGKIIPQHIIDVFPAGIINIHPSLLPLHRGSTPIESAMLAGASKTGVSLMRISRKMDAGDVYAYSEYPLDGTETKQDLADDLLELGSEMLVQTLPGILSGDSIGQPQDEQRATYDGLLTKQDGVMDLSQSVVQLEREVRAYLGWPGSRTVIAGKDVVITAAHIADESVENVDKKSTFIANKQLCLQTTDGILVIDTLKPAGRPTMPTSAFLAGYGHLL